MSTDGPVLSATGLRKRYGRTTALDGVSLDVHGGETVCVIGPNGAGKTTLLMLLGGVLLPNQGHVQVFGLDRWKQNYEIRKRSITVSAEPIFGTCVTPYEYLRLIGQIYGIPKPDFLARVKTLADEMDMTPHWNKGFDKLSLGMIKKTALMAAFLPNVELRILDEPFAGGIDPAAMDRLYTWFSQANARSETILFSTQVLEQAEEGAHRIVLLQDGAIRLQGPADEFIAAANIAPGEPRALYRAFIALTGGGVGGGNSDGEEA